MASMSLNWPAPELLVHRAKAVLAQLESARLFSTNFRRSASLEFDTRYQHTSMLDEVGYGSLLMTPLVRSIDLRAQQRLLNE